MITAVQNLTDTPPEILKIPNSSSDLLPETGGTGTYIITGTGAALMIIAAALILIKKKRQMPDLNNVKY